METNTVSKMLSTQTTEHEHDVRWAITDGVLYGMVDGFVFFRMPVEKLCPTWNADTEFQLGFEQWYVLNNGDVETIKDIEISFGEDALAKMVKDKTVESSESAGMTYEVFNGTYLADSANKDKYLYGNATKETQVMKATISYADIESANCAVGFTVKSGDKSVQFLTHSDGVQALVKLNHNLTEASFANWLHTDPCDSNGVCNVTAVVKNETLYIFYDDVLAGAVDLYKVIEGYVSGADVKLGIFSWWPNNGLHIFSDVSFKTGEDAENYISSNNLVLDDSKEWEIFTNTTAGTLAATTQNADGTVSGTNMTANGKTHVVTPTTGKSGFAGVYGVATTMPQMLTADIAIENAATNSSGHGVSVECNGKSVEFYVFGSTNYMRIQPNKGWNLTGDSKDSPIKYDFPEGTTKWYVENNGKGTGTITAIVKDNMLYLKYGNNVAYKARLDVVFPGYDGSAIRLGVCTWDYNQTVSEIANVRYTAGATVSAINIANPDTYKDIKFVAYTENMNSRFVITNNGDVKTETTSSKRGALILNGESDVCWVYTGKPSRGRV